MLNRRKFLKAVAVSGAGLYALPGYSIQQPEKITILHTNDLHCRFEAFEKSDPRYGGRGGMNRISAYVKKMRKFDPELVLLDSGDFSQGTPYYNFFKGEVVLKLMSEMGYDATTIGNHEFDSGLENLSEVSHFANFPMLSANYDFSRTPMNGIIKKNTIIERKGIRIGIYGIGIELQGLVGKSLSGNTLFLDPLEVALEQEDYLRNDQKCDLVICLSHLGFKYKKPKMSDMILAQKTRYTDAILGGHTHTFMDEPVEVLNQEKQPVIINQVGWAALMLGQLDFYFEKQKRTVFNFSNKNVGS